MPPVLSEILTANNGYIFRITHRDNVPHLIANGVHSRNSACVNPNFVEIGHPEIIDKRQTRAVLVPPYGTLADYVPFYFTPCSPMLYNIVTGWKGLRQRSRSEIVVLVSSLKRLEEAGIAYVIADRNATLLAATIAPGRGLIESLSWENWRNRDFKHDPNKPDKVERYQAEILVHRHLPAPALGGIITYDESTQVLVAQSVTDAGLTIGVHARPAWYP
jgi:hypothetical protein